MKLGTIALQLRGVDTRFDSLIGGAADLDLAMRGTLEREMAFVIQLSDAADQDRHDTMVHHQITERFAVVCALKNDRSQRDKLGITAYDSIHDTRASIFKGILGWVPPEADEPIRYGGGRLIDINAGWLWYQFEFTLVTRVEQDTDGWWPIPEDDLNAIHIDGIVLPDNQGRLPAEESLPMDASEPDFGAYIDLNQPPTGGFIRAFSPAFNVQT